MKQEQKQPRVRRGEAKINRRTCGYEALTGKVEAPENVIMGPRMRASLLTPGNSRGSGQDPWIAGGIGCCRESDEFLILWGYHRPD